MGTKVITHEAITELLGRAAAAPRKRLNLNLHLELTDPINRFVNAGYAGTYIRPHRHRVGKWELVNLLRGRLDVVIFAASGSVKSRFPLSPMGTSLIEIPGGEWHSFFFHAPAAVVLEVKPGPYEQELDKEFASWAPTEDDAMAGSFTSWLESAAAGEVWSG